MAPIKKDKRIVFFDKVYPEPNTGCWLYSGNLNESGYGRVDPIYYDGFVTAHRFSYYIHNGNFDKQLCVLHKCDVRSCVNPIHLFLGTNKDNMADMVAKGRSPNGLRNPKCKLTEVKVREIRSLNGLMNSRDIAKKYKMGATAIKCILNGTSWRHLK